MPGQSLKTRTVPAKTGRMVCLQMSADRIGQTEKSRTWRRKTVGYLSTMENLFTQTYGFEEFTKWRNLGCYV